MNKKKVYCYLCPSELKIRADFQLRFEYDGKGFSEALCSMHTIQRNNSLRDQHIIPTIQKIDQPIPMLWA